MGRGHLIRPAAFAALLLCVPAAAPGTRVSWLLQGGTELNGTQTPHAYLAAARGGSRAKLGRVPTLAEMRFDARS